MATVIKTWTVEDLLAMPDDGRRYELVRGELIEMGRPGNRHARLQLRIGRLLAAAIEDAGLGTVMTDSGVVVARSPDTVLGPDVAVYLGVGVDPRDEPVGYPDHSPALVVEIISPSNSAIEMFEKSASYLDAGVQMVVVVWPSSDQVTVETMAGRSARLGVDDVLDLSSVAPGIVISIASVFTGTLRNR